MARSEARSSPVRGPVRGFEPNWSTHPGEHLQEYLELRGWNQAHFAHLAGLTPKLVSEIVNAKNPVTPETALKFERVFGLKAYVWLNLQASWDLHIAKKKGKHAGVDAKSWLKRFPISDLKRRGWLSKTCDESVLVEELLRFFGIGEPAAFGARLAAFGVRHRQSQTCKTSDQHIATWLIIGEHRARAMDLPPFDEAHFLEAVREIRSLTTEPPQIFEPRMKVLCQQAGVALVLEPPIPRTALFGSTHWLDGQSPVIQMSLRGKWNDHFWWTFFHEAGHVILHGGKTFIEENREDRNICEQEANDWALEQLVGRERFEAFKAERPQSKSHVESFARSVDLHTGIIVGMLQHEEVIPYSNLNGLKERLDWAET